MSQAAVTTPDEAVAYVNRVGLCAWRHAPKLPAEFPTLEAQTPWNHTHDAIMQMWFWKDDLHIEKRLFYGQLLGRDGIPAFVSLSFLPYLIAAQGDADARDLYEKNRLSHVALALYEHLERNGPTAKNRLPYPPKTSQTPPLIALQQKFLITKTGLTGRTRGTYGYIWGLCDAFLPDAFVQAAQIPVVDARAHIVAHLHQNGLPELTMENAARLFRWEAIT